MKLTQKYTLEEKEVFLSEAKQHIRAMNKFLLKLEKSPQNMEFSYGIFRSVHTLKSISALMGYQKMSGFCHAIEDVLSGIKKKRFRVEKCADLLFESFDALDAGLREIANGAQEPDNAGLIRKLQFFDTSESAPGASDPQTAKLEKVSAIEVNVQRLDILMNLCEELWINKLSLDRLKEHLRHPELTTIVDALGRVVNDVQYNVMQSRMVSLSFIFDKFLRLVRDLSKQQGKEIELRIEGADIELDRSMMDEIGESLIHLLKNAVDHGIEMPQERVSAGKPRHGTISLTALRERGFVVIRVSDDGKGIDYEAIKNQALKSGVISPVTASGRLSDYIFSGVSTAEKVTQVSGRGMGMNIVKNKIESLGGSIQIESERQKGTKIIIEIPLTLAVVNALLIQVGDNIYAIPVESLERLVVVNSRDIMPVADYEAIVLEKADVPVIRLGRLFNISPGGHLEKQPVVIIKKGSERIGLAVDSLMSTQEIVIKPLNKLARDKRYTYYFAATAIIGSGEPILVLDVVNLVAYGARREKVNERI